MKFLTLIASTWLALLNLSAHAFEVCTPIKGGGQICEMTIQSSEYVMVAAATAPVVAPAQKPRAIQSPAVTEAKEIVVKPKLKPAHKTAEGQKPPQKEEKPKASESPIQSALKKVGLSPGDCFSSSEQLSNFLAAGWGIKNSQGVQWVAPGKKLKKGFNEKAFFSFSGSPITMETVYAGSVIPGLPAEVCIPENVLSTTNAPALIATIKAPFGKGGSVSISPNVDGTVNIASVGKKMDIEGRFKMTTDSARETYISEYKKTQTFAQK